ncbi:sugar transporter [Vibrio sp. 10N.286.49.C2]|uniref:polysaccharide export protein n=1 Tax=unclassified Vibrio TaxID=2614977 RepID=UPI000C836C90|nr:MULTISPECIES: polysaccharide export protein [unclassified Vibrio]PMH42384.1 sugar transporter [Vibrio sp. 10N.286.49.C2]PMH46928.1 sugar transporter [Vibrio sp. 10N.286.49.B1]
MNNVKKFTITALFPLLIAGCTLPGGHISTSGKNVIQAEGETTDLSERVNVYPLTPERVASFKIPEPVSTPNPTLDLEVANYQYRVGPGDILNITIWDHPELTIPAGSYRSSAEAGNWVSADGTIFYPYIGFVEVAGKTVREIRKDITARLVQYIESPQVDVNVAAFRSKKVYVTGEVDSPGQKPVTNIPMTLLDAINLAGGLETDADWRNVSLTRNGVEERVSLYALMQKGDLTQNRLMQPGDIIHVPRNDAQKIFVMGEVGEPQTLKMERNGMSLTEALSSVGGINEVAAEATGIFVIRPTRADEQEKIANIYQLNMQDATALFLGTEFELQPYDVVYVTATPLARWNRLMTQLLPTLTGMKNIADTGNSYRAWGN